MLDIKFIRQNIDEVKEKLSTRGVKEEVLNEFVTLKKGFKAQNLKSFL